MDERKTDLHGKVSGEATLEVYLCCSKRIFINTSKANFASCDFFCKKRAELCALSECSLFIFVSRSGLSRYEGDLQIGIIAEIYGNLDPSQIRDNPSSKYFHVEATECVSPALLVLLSIFLRMLVMLF